MRKTPSSLEKPLFWVASSKRDLVAMPEAVRREFGLALSVAQHGGRHGAAKPWKGEGPGVFEVVSDHVGDTFRAVKRCSFDMRSTCCTASREVAERNPDR